LASAFLFPSIALFLFSHKYGRISVMRTTVDIPDSLYRALKKKAAHEGNSVKELVLRGVELELGTKREPRRRRRPPVIDSDKPGSLDLDNAKIYEIISFP
jgi:hypothetical protein